MKAGFVFLHGAGLGSYIWRDVLPTLTLPALTIDYPNREQDDNVNRNLSFEDYTREIIRQIDGWDCEKLILVGHSIGGCLGLKVVRHYGSRIAGFVGLGAAIPANGGSFVSCLPFPQRLMMPLLLNLAGTRPPRSMIERGLCHDLSSTQTDEVVRRFTPESKRLYTSKCGAGIPSCLRMYIKLTDDKEFPMAVQDKMAKNLAAERVVSIHSGHLPMMSRPMELTDTLNRFFQEALNRL